MCRGAFIASTALGVVAVVCAVVVHARVRGIYAREYVEVHLYDEECEERRYQPESSSSSNLSAAAVNV